MTWSRRDGCRSPLEAEVVAERRSLRRPDVEAASSAAVCRHVHHVDRHRRRRPERRYSTAADGRRHQPSTSTRRPSPSTRRQSRLERVAAATSCRRRPSPEALYSCVELTTSTEETRRHPRRFPLATASNSRPSSNMLRLFLQIF